MISWTLKNRQDSILFVILILLSLADVCTTWFGIHIAGMYEANLMLAGVAGSFWGLMLLKLAAIFGVCLLWRLFGSRWIPAAAAAVWLLPVLNNSFWLAGWWLCR